MPSSPESPALPELEYRVPRRDSGHRVALLEVGPVPRLDRVEGTRRLVHEPRRLDAPAGAGDAAPRHDLLEHRLARARVRDGLRYGVRLEALLDAFFREGRRGLSRPTAASRNLPRRRGSPRRTSSRAPSRHRCSSRGNAGPAASRPCPSRRRAGARRRSRRACPCRSRCSRRSLSKGRCRRCRGSACRRRRRRPGRRPMAEFAQLLPRAEPRLSSSPRRSGIRRDWAGPWRGPLCPARRSRSSEALSSGEEGDREDESPALPRSGARPSARG